MYKSAGNKKEGGGQVHLIKLHNLKYYAHDKNFKINLAIGKSNTTFFFPPLFARLRNFIFMQTFLDT